jgi:RNA polymerase sigma-70 factor (ECF subfamily)
MSLTAEVRPGSAETTVIDFDAFYALEYPRLLPLAYVLTGSHGLAEELVQETMIRALRHWRRVREYEKPGAWARRVLLNLATSKARRVAAEARALVRLGGPRAAELEPSVDTSEVWQAVRALPAREAQALALHYLEDMSVVDMATVLDCPEGTVKTLLYRARKLLAAKLGEEEPA